MIGKIIETNINPEKRYKIPHAKYALMYRILTLDTFSKILNEMKKTKKYIVKDYIIAQNKNFKAKIWFSKDFYNNYKHNKKNIKLIKNWYIND